jgi:hypothetical protein
VRPSHTGALEAVDRILNRGGSLEEVLAVLHERVFAWIGVEGTALEAGERPPEPPLRAGALAAEPREPSPDDRALLDRVALLVSHLL